MSFSHPKIPPKKSHAEWLVASSFSSEGASSYGLEMDDHFVGKSHWPCNLTVRFVAVHFRKPTNGYPQNDGPWKRYSLKNMAFLGIYVKFLECIFFFGFSSFLQDVEMK